MINRFEAIGIFTSISFMALALFLLNMQTATQALDTTGQQSASVVFSEDNASASVANALDATGNVEKLLIDDVLVGSGPSVVEGDTVSVNYIGTLQNGEQFDNSYLRAEPFQFTVGEGKVIAGWEEGIVGMKAGGQRILVIPAEMAYGDREIGPIPAGSPLVFAIELMSIDE